MQIIFSPAALEDIKYWKETGNVQILKKIRRLLESISSTPFEGIGKPEALKHNWSGYWSRRITKEHRLIYSIEKDAIMVAQARNHYE